MLLWAFTFTNAVFILVNCIDVGYFPFTKKRAGLDLIRQIGGQTDLGKLLPQYLLDFWWLLIIYILIIALMVYLYRRIKFNFKASYVPARPKHWLRIVPLFLLAAGFAVLGARGGLQRIPIDIVNAGSVTSPEEIPIVLNTPFTLIKSVDRKPLEELNYYSPAELKTIYSPLHEFKDSVFRKKNVVVIILESFSKEYTKLGHTISITPFLDSLMDHSLLFTNAFSNGTKSIEGIPAILSSLPSYMENPFINSNYANNTQTSFASLLGKEGYETAFFHGGINGTMNFDNWASLAGYNNYFGKNEYHNDADFDGYWGIWDEPFLQYSVKKMSGFKTPFHSAIFTLSSHHPYFVPEKYKGKFLKTKLENSESVGYADHALRLFFDAAKKTGWYKNTLFILSADHCSLSEHRFFGNYVGYLTIPVMFYTPDNAMAGTSEKVFGQLDILPSALNYLGYNKPFFAFGENYTSDKGHNCYYYSQGIHYLYEDSMNYQFNDKKLSAVYNYRRDSVLANNILGRDPVADSLINRKFKAFMQTYNYTLIHNSGTLK